MKENLRKKLNSSIGKKVHIKVNNVRNKTENFIGIIKEVYPAIFIVLDEMGNVRSFMYSDILTGNVELTN